MKKVKIFSTNIEGEDSEKEIKSIETLVNNFVQGNPGAEIIWFQSAGGAGAGNSRQLSYHTFCQLTAIIEY